MIARPALLAAPALALLLVPGLAHAQAPTTTTVTPPGAETTIAVADEAEYRAALTTLSADASGPHRIDLVADITLDDGTDPTYTGTQSLTIDGHGFTLDGGGTSRLLVVDAPSPGRLELRSLRLTGGEAQGDGGAVLVLGDWRVAAAGGEVVANHASGNGGALFVPSHLQLDQVTLRDNRAEGDGGAVDTAVENGVVDAVDSLFDGNAAPDGAGGAIAGAGGSIQRPPSSGTTPAAVGRSGSRGAGSRTSRSPGTTPPSGAVASSSGRSARRSSSTPRSWPTGRRSGPTSPGGSGSPPSSARSWRTRRAARTAPRTPSTTPPTATRTTAPATWARGPSTGEDRSSSGR